MKLSNTNLKIFVTFFKDVPLLDIFNQNKNIFIPIHCGRQCYNGNSNFLLSMIGDNDGKNISLYNPYICELTAIYWIYHNFKQYSTFIGLNHYRRFFSSKYNLIDQKTIVTFKCNFETSINVQFFKNHNDKIKQVSLDFLNFLFKRDQFKEELIEFYKYIENQKVINICNMFIMPSDIFKNYYGKVISNILDILIEFIKSRPDIKLEPKLFSYILQRLGSFFLYKASLLYNCKLEDGLGAFVKL